MWSKAVSAGVTRPGTAAGAGPRPRRAASAALIVGVVLLAASAVPAQTVTNSILVATDERAILYPGFDPAQRFTDLGDAVAEAITRAAAAYRHYEVVVDEGTWDENLSIPADADISIRGGHGTVSATPDTPQDVVIRSTSAMLDVIEMYAPMDPSAVTQNFEIEGVTLTGGRHGFRNDVPGSVVTLNRVYIRDNADSGVLTENGGNVLLVNCSIVNNGRDGVSVDSFATADIVFCSIIRNMRAGVFVYSDPNVGAADALVAATIVYDNAQSGLEWTVPPSVPPTLDSNDVFMNPDTGPSNYVNVAPDAASVAADPFLWEDTVGGAPWLGALAASRSCYEAYNAYGESPVIDKAPLDLTTAFAPFSLVDFEDEPRPVAFPFPPRPGQALPDIGADEVVCSFVIVLPIWTECIVTPNPLGKVAAGDARIQIRLTPALLPEEFSVFVVPQDGDPDDPLDRIPFQFESQAGDIYFFTNSGNIDTLLRDADGSGGLSAGDLITDGHAQVYIEILTANGIILGHDDVTNITGQAVLGRHFILDTTPPRMVLTGGGSPLGLGADEIVAVLNTAYDYTTGGVNPSTHPAFPATGLQATDAFPVLVPDGSHDGLISLDPTTADPNDALTSGPGTHMFVNVASRSNGPPAVGAPYPAPDEPLNLEVTVRFEDPQPHLPDGTVFLPERVVAGFVQGTGAFDTVNTPNNPIAQWNLAAGAGLMSLVTAHCEYTSTGPNIGFNPLSPGDETFDYANSHVTAVWTFVDNSGPAPTFGFNPAKAPRHASIQFRGLDRAGNALDFSRLAEPLHLWWMVEAQTILSPNFEGQTLSSPTFDLRLLQAETPVVPRSAPVPIFLYRTYQAASYGGPYKAVGGWNPITTSQLTISSDPTDPTFNPTLQGRWVLLVVVGTDEAGNVEMWPFTDLDHGPDPDDPGSDPFNLAAPLGQRQFTNWQRFRLGVGNIDTAILPTFWHDGAPFNGVPELGEANFGSQNIIPSPTNFNAARVAAEFRVNMTATDLVNAKVYWQIFASDVPDPTDPGAPLYFGVAPQFSPGTAVITLPPLANPGDRFEDTVDPRRPRYYVFYAWTFIDTSNFGVLDAEETIDDTPASFPFTVVPEATIEAYVRNRESLDRQPVKVQEEQ